MGRGWVYKCLGEYDKSVEDFSAVLAQNPEKMEARFERAGTYIGAQKYSSALTDLQFAMTRGFTHPYLQLALAHVYYKLGDLHKALASNSEALSSTDNQVKAAAYFQEGLFAMAGGRIEEAESFYKEGMIIGEKTRSFVAVENAIIYLEETIRDQQNPIHFRQKILEQLVQVSETMKPVIEPDPTWCQMSSKQGENHKIQ